MKVLITASGSGLGHVRRMDGLAKKLRDSGVKVTLGICQPIAEKIRQNYKAHKLATEFSIPLLNNSFGFFKSTGYFSKFLMDLPGLISESNALISRTNPDLVISDGHLSSIIAAHESHVPSVAFTNMPSVPPIPAEFSRILDLSRRISQFTVSEIYSMCETVFFIDLFGLQPTWKNSVRISPFVKKMPDLKRTEEIRKRLGDFVFIEVGGSTLGLPLIRLIRKANLNSSILVCCGPSIKVADFDNAKFTSPYLSNIEDYFHASSAVITLSGYETISEVCAIGKPLVVSPIPGHTEQLSNAMNCASKGIAEVYYQNGLRSLGHCLATAVEKENEMTKRQKLLIRGNGIIQATEMILNEFS